MAKKAGIALGALLLLAGLVYSAKKIYCGALAFREMMHETHGHGHYPEE